MPHQVQIFSDCSAQFAKFVELGLGLLVKLWMALLPLLDHYSLILQRLEFHVSSYTPD
jgi:hypothetical protein